MAAAILAIVVPVFVQFVFIRAFMKTRMTFVNAVR
jgi:hypothetical protein